MNTSETQLKNIQPVSGLYRNYVLLMLTIVYIFNFIDRQILVVLQESIKQDLGLSDTQLGLLSGLSFALFYVSLGIPIARLADRSNRRNIVAISLTVWSAMTAVCGMAQNFFHLLLARMGVGVGEAGASPPAHSMISDYFPEDKRATALSIYSVGIYLGIMIGWPLGSYLDNLFGWRIAFLAIGLPGVLFAVLFYLSVKEPIRKQEIKKTKESGSFKIGCQYLLSKKSFVFLALAAGFHTFASYGLGNWLASFIIRLHLPNGEIEAANIGLIIGFILGTAGGLGSFLGGYFADKLGKKDKTWYFKVSAYGGIIAIPFLLVFCFYSTTLVALTCLFIGYTAISTFLGPSIAIAHSIVPAKMRAFASSVLFLALNLIGLGFGPLVVGVVSDLLAPSLGADSLRWAVASTLFSSVLAIFLFLKASKYVDSDLKVD
ncbi:MAG: spinster family MFS transporter [Kangiellaceae bacterium]